MRRSAECMKAHAIACQLLERYLDGQSEEPEFLDKQAQKRLDKHLTRLATAHNRKAHRLPGRERG